MNRKFTVALLILLSFLTQTIFAQFKKSDWNFVKNGSFYVSWGYNGEWYTRSTVHVSQPSLGNDYDLVKVHGHDHPGWNEGLLNKAMTIPQYNYRIGYFFNEKQDLGFEINFDHTKYIITDNQDVHIRGKYNGQNIDEKKKFSEAEGSFYYLNNGANFLLFNLVKRYRLTNATSTNVKLDLLAKVGVGPVIPHVENSFWGLKNKPDFQIGGWNTGVETALKLTLFRYAYIEFAQKFDYARYSGLKIYEGTAKQAFGSYQLILNLGFTFPTGKHNKDFARHADAVPTSAPAQQ
jgi:hypothetical protein